MSTATTITFVDSPFYQTRIVFRDYTGYTGPVSYDEWMEVPHEMKAAYLYLQFYDQITLAYMKLKSVYTDEHDGVSEVLQYLNKNVQKIIDDKKRYTPAYIYKVAYNCLYCLCRDPNRYKRVWENECSNIVATSDGELDIFTVLETPENIGPAILDQTRYINYLRDCNQFWKIIWDMGKDVRLVVADLLGESSYTESEFASVSEERREEILEELKIRLAEFVRVFNEDK